MRRMPIELFADLVRRLLEDPEVDILVTGVASERPDAQDILLAGVLRRACLI